MDWLASFFLFKKHKLLRGSLIPNKIHCRYNVLGNGEVTPTMVYSQMNSDVLREEHERFSPLQGIEDAERVNTRRGD